MTSNILAIASYVFMILLRINAKRYSFDCQQVAWFMGVAWEPSIFDRLNYVKFAIMSAQQHAPMLQPVLIFLQPEEPEPSREYNAWMDWFHENNVIICNVTETLMFTELKKHGGNNQMIRNTDHPRIKYPIFFRLDIDEYFQQCITNLENVDQNYALYTDTDVAIVKEINSCNLPKPELLYIGAEHQLDKIRNTGVIVVNIKSYAREKKEFAEFARDKWDHFANDQALIDTYFHFNKDKVQFLPNEFNYKMYWEGLELQEDPIILHSHGYKYETPCFLCLIEVSSKDEAKEKCPKCNNILWFMYGNPHNLFQLGQTYYNKLVYKEVPYYNSTTKSMVVG
eukprot:TRINITY_DN1165_c1_g1_i1.p1 TRINITY_DN1165_c1_g1~~TRINITY_DN1165_c1_g1_i1.p1  ORF type:complete len:379 (-),score=7.58 TRINITY_DN1165_c1_g1_i1:631-1647(-)